MYDLQLLTIPQLAEAITNMINFVNFEKSEFLGCIFSPVNVLENHQYSNKELEDMAHEVTNCFGIGVFASENSASLFVGHYDGMVFQYRADRDGSCLFDHHKPKDYELEIQTALWKTLERHGIAADENQFVLIEFTSEEAANEHALTKDITIETECKEGVCPVCGEMFYYGTFDLVDEGGVYHWECAHCGASGKEGYDLVFDGHHYDVKNKNGEAIKIVDPKSDEQIEPVSDDNLLCEAGDAIDNAIFAAIQALCPNKLEWDMSLIADVADRIESAMRARKIPVCHPWENEEGHICYSIQEERCYHCTHH